MAVVKATIASQLLALMNELESTTYEVAEDGSISEAQRTAAKEAYANGFADLIAEAILSITVVVPTPIPVQVVPSTGLGGTIATAEATVT